MKGNNILELNTSTMIEAVQEYLNKRMGEFSPIVKDVQSTGKYEGTFRVSVGEE